MSDDPANDSAITKGTSYNAQKVLSALGGKENIQSLDNCVTRLRLVVDVMDKVDEKILKEECGALGVVILDEHNLQVVIGPQVGLLKSQIEKIS
ncbi:glucose PTS transporter subunit EIIB [Peribacillus sp. FSL E2-0218]